MYFAFMRTKQPERIREVLNMVYVDKQSVDADLVASIENPANDPAAPEVFYLVSNTVGPTVYVDSLLAQLRVPLLLLWGDRDPWITPARVGGGGGGVAAAQRVMDLYPSAVKVGLDSGHCPHDDTPEAANAALIGWLNGLPKEQQQAPAASAAAAAAAAAPGTA
ncbi:hypothetical protein TSOC_014486 [Tetrabaena socialis]|uniref:AB hydrolase-1 domain-containing protein n=1 Tax=Tetrabaena socialis TaxID=47790 RepID=A0A2J7ZHJ1_9CHLO|nr:hypothetical protein TSOC_014486 [Tetrabaena socialis]|eukprot:PNG99731.1 hypothetical protein TSOC_014486 [Tetrabaena socialis]